MVRGQDVRAVPSEASAPAADTVSRTVADATAGAIPDTGTGAVPDTGTGAVPDTAADSTPRFRLTGDLRVRGALDRDRRTAADRERGRLRLRLGAEGELGRGVTVGMRLTTRSDPDDPNSPFVDLGSGFSRAEVELDRIFVRWEPDVGRPLGIVAGKFPHPFRMPAAYGELTWDADVQPEGLAVTAEPLPWLRLVGGGYLLLTQSDGEDANLGVFQAESRLEPVRGLKLSAALGGYVYGTPDEVGARELARDNQGNALVTNATGDTLAFRSEFTIWHLHAGALLDRLALPVAVEGEYFVNSRAAAGFDDDGFALGARVRRPVEPFELQVEYRYQRVGQEALFSPVVQDDFLDSVNFLGHLAGVSVRFLEFSRVRLWGLFSKRERPGEDSFQKRLRLDVDFSWSVSL